MSTTRRGGVYIAVLGVTLFVTLIGLSAMLLVETERETRIAVSESRIARTDARSVMEIALSRVAEDPAWRSSHRSGAWTETQTLGDTKWGYVLEYDEGTPADETVSVSMLVGARRNESARFFSVDADVPPPGTNLGANAVGNSDFEGGISPWTGYISRVESDALAAHGGTRSLLCRSRWFVSGGSRLSVTGAVNDNTDYELSAWVLLPNGASDEFLFSLNAVVGWSSTEDRFTSETITGGVWTRVTGTLRADWANGYTPSSVTLMVQTENTKTDFQLDDVTLREILPDTGLADVRPIVGTFRQRVVE